MERFVKIFHDNEGVDLAFFGTNQVCGDRIINRRIKALKKL